MELQRQWLVEAAQYKVLPLDDRLFETLNPDLAGWPALIRGTTQLLAGGLGRLSENCVLNIKNKSHSITAEVVVPEKGAEGVIVCQDANMGGWTLYTDGEKVGEGRLDVTLSTIFSANDGTDVGEDSGAAISPDYGPVGNHYSGEIKRVQLSIADDPNNHTVNPEDAIRVALGRE